jgi:hypothetical protein
MEVQLIAAAHGSDSKGNGDSDRDGQIQGRF